MYLSYLSLPPVVPESGHYLFEDLVDFLGHPIGDEEHSLKDGVWEESVLSKQGLNRWFKSFALHADLENGAMFSCE